MRKSTESEKKGYPDSNRIAALRVQLAAAQRKLDANRRASLQPNLAHWQLRKLQIEFDELNGSVISLGHAISKVEKDGRLQAETYRLFAEAQASRAAINTKIEKLLAARKEHQGALDLAERRIGSLTKSKSGSDLKNDGDHSILNEVTHLQARIRIADREIVTLKKQIEQLGPAYQALLKEIEMIDDQTDLDQLNFWACVATDTRVEAERTLHSALQEETRRRLDYAMRNDEIRSKRAAEQKQASVEQENARRQSS